MTYTRVIYKHIYTPYDSIDVIPYTHMNQIVNTIQIRVAIASRGQTTIVPDVRFRLTTIEII